MYCTDVKLCDDFDKEGIKSSRQGSMYTVYSFTNSEINDISKTVADILLRNMLKYNRNFTKLLIGSTFFDEKIMKLS